MHILHELLQANRTWSAELARRDADYFPRLSRLQTPAYLWIGCSDSRVPANEIVGLAPGELFVHRNVANVVVHSDLNCLSVVQYAVEVLRVRHIIVCGHYGCGGVLATLQDKPYGLIDNWLRHIQDLRERHSEQLRQLTTESQQLSRLCELNVIEQAVNVCQTTIVRDAWRRGQSLIVHGWIYGLHDGLLQDLGMCVGSPEELAVCYQRSISGTGWCELSGHDEC